MERRRKVRRRGSKLGRVGIVSAAKPAIRVPKVPKKNLGLSLKKEMKLVSYDEKSSVWLNAYKKSEAN